MYNVYETILFIRPEESLETVNHFTSELCNLVKMKGKNLFLKIVEKKKMAWTRKKYKIATLIYHKYITDANIVKKYESDLRSVEMCLLKQTIIVEKNVVKDEYKEMKKKLCSNAAGSEDYNFIEDISEEPKTTLREV